MREWERGTVGVGGRHCGRIHRREPKWEWVEGNVGVGGRQHIDKKILVAISIPYPAKR